MSASATIVPVVRPADPASENEARANTVHAEALHLVHTRRIDVLKLMEYTSTLAALGHTRKGADLYKTWIALNPGHQLLSAVYFNYSVMLSDCQDLPGSVIALRTAIQLNPDFFPPYINLGSVLDRLGMPEQALAEWGGLINQLPAVTGTAVGHKITALNQSARVLESLSRDSEAEEVLRQSLDLTPRQPEVIEHLIALRQRQCKWPVVAETERLTRQMLIGSMPPLAVFNYTDDAMFQLARAYCFNRTSLTPPKRADLIEHNRPRLARPGKLRIGYVSSDLRAHAVGFAMADVFETHDRDRFETFAYYCGIRRDDPIKSRIQQAADHWTDITVLDDRAAAARIAADGIDILVDLNGYTKDARTKVFALRPAPIAVNWFGFPGSMASPYHHYLIADDYIVPVDHEIYYSEKIVRLPCYQPNDRKRVVASTCPTRSQVGLPEDGFVYCCLNGMQKMPPLTFARWMRILQQVPGSVLWLLEGSAQTNQRVRQMAVQHGVAPERIVFASRASNPDHLARYALADLFLDTMPYGAHTTASDALWMGVPVLTVSGRTFSARVCGSVVRAGGLPDLICANFDEYIARAIEYGHNRAQTQALRQRLLDNRASSLLFDTPVLVRALETVYRQMAEAFACGERPVPDLRNLQIYHDLGVELDLESAELLDDTAYRALYRQQLEDLDAVTPLSPDGRFWQAGTSMGPR